MDVHIVTGRRIVAVFLTRNEAEGLAARINADPESWQFEADEQVEVLTMTIGVIDK